MLIWPTLHGNQVTGLKNRQHTKKHAYPFLLRLPQSGSQPRLFSTDLTDPTQHASQPPKTAQLPGIAAGSTKLAVGSLAVPDPAGDRVLLPPWATAPGPDTTALLPTTPALLTAAGITAAMLAPVGLWPAAADAAAVAVAASGGKGGLPEPLTAARGGLGGETAEAGSTCCC